MREYRRHLPHQVPDGAPIFVTWNLKGALPQLVLERLQKERDALRMEPRRKGESPRDRAVRHGKLVFAKADAFLDGANVGPLHLKDPVAAQIVEDAILFGVTKRYDLFAWCVMANHVHVLIAPYVELSKVMQGIKGYTAHQINQIHAAVGRTFWQDESYDHWARDEEELLRIIIYIEHNPVSAGLCQRPEDWLWSSARRRSTWPVGQAFQPDSERCP